MNRKRRKSLLISVTWKEYNMSYRKIYVAIDCRSEEEAQQVQKIAEDMSVVFSLSAKDIIAIYPSVRSNSGLIKSSIKAISKEGVKGIGKVVSYMLANFKKS